VVQSLSENVIAPFAEMVKPNTFTEAVTGVPLFGDAILLKLPVQVQGTVEANVQVTPGEQADKVPMFQDKLLPVNVCPAPPPPTQVTVPAQVGKLSVTVTFSLEMVDTWRLRKAVCPPALA
jgi:hypothetical protein